MGKKGSKFLALFMVLAMIVTYSFSMSILSVYADDEQGEVNAKANASEDATPAEPESKPDPKPEPTPEPDPPAPTEPSTPDTPDPGQSGGDSSGTGSDTGGSTDADTNSDSGDENDTSSESDDAVVDEATMTGELIEGVVEEEEEEVEYPEVTLHANAGGVAVTLHAPEGALPEGSKLSASRVNSQAILNAVEQRVESQGMEMVDVVAIDVTPLDKDGHAVQPKKSVTVTFSGTGLESGDGGVDVFHVSDGAGSVSEMGTSVASANKQQFSTNHFSIYVAASTASKPVGDGSSTTKRYVLEYGETVTIGSDESGTRTDTWSFTRTDAAQVTEQADITWKVENKNETSGDVNVTAHHYYRNWFELGHDEYFYITCKPKKIEITFKVENPNGSTTDIVKEVYKGSTATPPSAEEVPSTTTYDGKEYTFYGWYLDSDYSTSTTNRDYQNIQAPKTFYGKYSTEATIQYRKNSEGDDATVPEALTAGVGTKVHLSGNAHRDGYSLTGWKDENGMTYSPTQLVEMPAEGMILYAQWSSDTMVLRYHYNYADSPGDGVFKSVSGLPKNSRTALTTDAPTRPRDALTYFIFRGWSSNPYASDPQYYPGETFTTGSNNIQHLYAVWGRLSLNTLTPLTANSAEEFYDGTEKSVSGVTGGTPWSRDNNYILVGETAYLGFDIYAYVGDIKATGTDAGRYATPVSAPLYYRVGNSMRRLEIKVGGITLAEAPYMNITGGTLWIKPAEIKISTDDAEKVYDGTELTAGGKATLPDGTEATFSNDGSSVTLYDGKTLNLRTTGSQKEVGQGDNDFDVDWGKPDDWPSDLAKSTAKKYNYSIVEPEKLGTLTVYLGVIFDKNAGSDTVTGMPKDLKITDLEDAAIPGDKPARDGYDFLGWAKDAGATKADYQPGAKLTMNDFSDAGKDGLVLYAVWKAKEPTPTPVTPDDDNAAGGGGAGGDGAADGDGAAVAAADATQTIVDNATPEAATINDNAAPKSAPTSHWALLNLIAAILTIIGSLIAAFRKNSATTAVKGVGLAAAAAGVIVFFATQSLGAPMQIADGWTILMAALFGVQCVTTGITAKTPAVDD